MGKNIAHTKEVTYSSLLKGCLFISQAVGNLAVWGTVEPSAMLVIGAVGTYRGSVGFWNVDEPGVWHCRNLFFKEPF